MNVQLFTERASTRWLAHVEQWQHCVLCPTGLSCQNHVLGRGQLPCDILFLGEAPGPEEDDEGIPFIGRAGKTLTALIRDLSSRLLKVQVRYAEDRTALRYFISNTLACFPEDPIRDTFRKPETKEVLNCTPRVHDLIRLAEPKGIVLLGKAAEEAHFRYIKDQSIPVLCVWHPSYINRNGGTASLHYKKVRESLVTFVSSLYRKE